MSLDWVISLAAVAASIITVIVGYLTNKENLAHNMTNMVASSKINLNSEIWKELSDLCNNLVLISNTESFEKHFNNVIILKNEGKKDDDILNIINEEIVKVHSLIFNICTKISVLNSSADTLKKEINNYGDKTINVYENISNFYLDDDISASDFEKTKSLIGDFNKENKEFALKLQNEISLLQEKIFN